MTKSWSIEIGRDRYAIEYKATFGVKIIVNGQANKVKSKAGQSTSLIIHCLSPVLMCG